MLVAGTDGGDETGEECAKSDDADGEDCDDAVDMNGLDAIHVLPRVHQPLQCSPGEEQTECAASDCEQQAFDEPLAHQAHPAAAESGANGEFLAACCGTRDQQAGDIHAGDEQHASGGGEHCIERRLIVMDNVIEHGAA